MAIDPRGAAMLGGIAAELTAARGELEALGLKLCCDPHVAAAHFDCLQGLDRIAQIIGEAAGLLGRGDAVAGALAAVRLEEMRGRLADFLRAA